MNSLKKNLSQIIKSNDDTPNNTSAALGLTFLGGVITQFGALIGEYADKAAVLATEATYSGIFYTASVAAFGARVIAVNSHYQSKTIEKDMSVIRAQGTAMDREEGEAYAQSFLENGASTKKRVTVAGVAWGACAAAGVVAGAFVPEYAKEVAGIASLGIIPSVIFLLFQGQKEGMADMARVSIRDLSNKISGNSQETVSQVAQDATPVRRSPSM